MVFLRFLKKKYTKEKSLSTIEYIHILGFSGEKRMKPVNDKTSSVTLLISRNYQL